jgi:hypothetical protein
MPKSTATANAIINLMYRAAAWANVADNAGSSPATNVYVSMHTASPGTGDDQTTNETAYTNYARAGRDYYGALWRTDDGNDTPLWAGHVTILAAAPQP